VPVKTHERPTAHPRCASPRRWRRSRRPRRRSLSAAAACASRPQRRTHRGCWSACSRR